MTAKVVLAQSNLNLDAKVTIQTAYSDTSCEQRLVRHLIVGDKVTVRQLLYGLMLRPAATRVRARRQVRHGHDACGPREVVHRQDEHGRKNSA